MSSRGGNIYPDYESQKDIRMEKERVYIKMYIDSIDVYCKFWFYSTVKNKNNEYVNVGFPNFTEGPGGASPELRNFKTKVNGKEVDVILAEEKTTFKDLKTGKLTDAELIIKSWFLWGVEFKQNDTTIVENWYTGSWGGSYASKSFEYLVGTGGTWDSTIGDGKIVFDHSNLVSSAFVDGKGDSASLNPLNVASYRDSTVYHFKNYRPNKHLTLFISFISFWDDPYHGRAEGSFEKIYQGPLGLKYFLKKKKEEGFDLRLMRNEIYARHGYLFKDKKLQDYFESTSWYKVNKKFLFEDLNKYEIKTVNTIVEIEKEKK